MSKGFVNERGSRAIELRKSSGELAVLGRLNAVGVDQLLAVDRATYDANWQLDTVRTTWVLTDRQGTVRDLLGKDVVNGTAYTQHIDYDAFGIPSDISGLASEVTTYYAGREYDSYTDLYYNRARWYDAAMQRFISEDPIGFAGGDPNLYRYCGNSPVNATDPSGMLWGYGFAAGGAAIGGLSYVGISLLTGHDLDWKEFVGAAVGGAVAGLVAGALTGDATSAVGLIGIGLVSGAAGGATTSLVTQSLTTGTVDMAQLGRDTAFGAIGGAVGAGLGVAVSRVAPTIFGGMTGSTGPSLALAGGGVLGRGTAVASSLSAATSQSIVRGMTVGGQILYSVGRGGEGVKATPGPSGRVSTKKYLEKNWDRGTFGNAAKSIEYHLGKHGKGMSPVQYTQQARKAFANALKKTKTTDLRGRAAVRVDAMEGSGLFTPEGRIIWFHPN